MNIYKCMCSWTRYFWQAVDDNRGIQDDTKGANKTREVTWGWGGHTWGEWQKISVSWAKFGQKSPAWYAPIIFQQ